MTVSKALRGASDISEATRERVLVEAGRRGYVPNLMARDLLRRRSKSIGFIFPDLTFGYAQNIVEGAKSILKDREYRTLIGLASSMLEEEAREVDLMLGHQIEGMICLPVPGSDETYQRIVDNGIPLVFVASSLDIPLASRVGLDMADASRKVMQHLYDLGHRRIAFVAPDTVEQSAALSPALSGYADFLVEQGVGVDQELIGLGRVGHAEEIAPMVDRFALFPHPPTAIFAISDSIAYSVMDRLMQTGRKIPGDISVAGVGGLGMSSIERISLTTVEEDSYQIGVMAAEIIMKQLSNEKEPPVQKLLKGPLIARRSTGRIPGNME